MSPTLGSSCRDLQYTICSGTCSNHSVYLIYFKIPCVLGSCGFKLGDHYRMLLSMVFTSLALLTLFLLLIVGLRHRRERESARCAAETAQNKEQLGILPAVLHRIMSKVSQRPEALFRD